MYIPFQGEKCSCNTAFYLFYFNSEKMEIPTVAAASSHLCQATGLCCHLVEKCYLFSRLWQHLFQCIRRRPGAPSGVHQSRDWCAPGVHLTPWTSLSGCAWSTPVYPIVHLHRFNKTYLAYTRCGPVHSNKCCQCSLTSWIFQSNIFAGDCSSD